MKRPLYLDYAASTPIDSEVAAVMQACLGREGAFGNPSSGHVYGQEAQRLIAKAREQVASFIHCDPEDIIWTSGATEANNLALRGAAQFHQKRGRHIVTSMTEHRSVLDTCRQLEKVGFEVTYLKPERSGLIALEAITNALRDDTILVSLMHVNNEIGVIYDIAAIGAVLREKGILFHVDAVQSIGKLPIDCRTLPVDMMTFSAHKLYGPKGSGCLYLCHKPRARIQAIITGGGQEKGLRSGTLATHQIVGMGEAVAVAQREMAEENARIEKFRDQLWQQLQTLEGVYLNGSFEHRVVHNLNVSFDFVEGEALLLALEKLALSSGSACSAARIEPSHVLQAIDCPDHLIHSALRITFGRYVTEKDVAFAGEYLCERVAWLRSLSPVWEQHNRAV